MKEKKKSRKEIEKEIMQRVYENNMAFYEKMSRVGKGHMVM